MDDQIIDDPPKIPEEPISIPETVERRTIVSETHVTKIVSSSFSDVGPSHQSFTESSSSHITSATGLPTVEVHGSRIQQVSQEGSEPPQVSEKEKVIKIDGQNIVEQFITDTATAAPPALPKKTVVKRKSTPARFIVPLQGVIVQENNKVTFEASIDGYPEPTVEWSHNGGPLPPEATTSFELNKVSLAIPKVQQHHSGRYTCSLDNEAGSAQCTCDLVVKKIQFPPVFSKRLQPLVIGVGERLHLEVDLSGTPTPDVQWTRNGQDLFSGDQLIIKGEGTRHWLVIPEAVESDSGRYGVTGSNSAGRAECLADVLVTKLTISEPQQTFIFRDLSDDTRSQSKVIEAGHVKSLKEIVEARSFETHVPLPPVNLVKSVNDIPLQPKPTPSEVTAAPPPTSIEVSEEHFEKEERKLPGKLRFSWPPPPSDDESLEAVKVDPYLDIAQNKVSTIVSTFSSITEPELPPIEKPPKHITEFNYLAEEKSPELPIPEPAPEYGFIQVEDKVEISADRVVEHDKSLTPEVYDTDFSDIVASTSVTSDYYPKTSPSFELDSIEKPQSSLLLSTKDDLAEYPEKELEAKESEEDMEVRTERHVRESSITEVTKSVSSSEKTIVETKIYRDYSDGLDAPIFQQATPSQVQEVVTENISEHVIPESEQPVESTKEYEVEEYKYDLPEQQSYVEKHEEDIPDTSSAAEGPFFSHSFSSKEKSYASTVKESHASYVSSTEIESKVYPYQQGESSRSSVFESTQSFLKPATVVVEEKKSADEMTSGDEARTLEIKPRKKRESVRQIALRLEENIMPISPEEVPGGIRMFPPKPQTPSVDSPQPSFISKEKASIIPEEEIVEEKPIFSDFPKLEPFPFVVEEKPTVERLRGPPPAKPKKFVPGAFIDSEYDSDFDLPIGEKFIPKKIHFEGTTKPVPKAKVPGPPPPSFFDSPPKIEAMRPEILTKDTIFEAKIEDKPKEVIPRKQPRVVQKFFDKAGQHAELEITSPKASKGIVHSEVQSETFQQKKVAFIDESHIQMPAKPVSPAPSKIKKAWPPQQEEIVVEEFTSPPETVVITRASEVSQQMHVKEFIEVERKEEKMEHPQEKLPIIEIDVVKKPAFTAETLPKPELPQVPHITPLASKFKSVQAPSSFQAKKPQEARAGPAPPFDIPFPTIEKPVPTKMEPSFSINKVFSTTSVETKQITQRESKTIQEQTQSKDFQLRKQRSSWPPKVDESPAPVATPPWMEVRSQSLERPHVTEATILPPKSYEAPPSIYWSSSISLKEKRASLPMQFVQDPPIITSSVDEKILTASSLKNIHESSSTTIEQLRQQKPYHKHVTIAEAPSVSRKLLVKSPVAHRRPTPAPDEMILGKKETKPLEKLPSKMMIDIADIGFKPIPKGEPFPFEVPREQEKRRDNVPPPSKPSKFIPGSFTESDYESDYEGKVPPVWRPYMSDTESTSFRPVKVKLKQGRHRQPKGPSPPPPSQFDSPSNVIIPLKPSLSLLDFASEVPLVTEPSLIKVTADLKKKQLPSTTFTPKLAALQPKIVAHQPKIVAHQQKIVAPQPKIIAPQPKIIAPQPRIVVPQPKIAAPQLKTAAPTQQMPLPVKSQVSAAPVRKEVKVAEPIPKKTTVGVRSVKEKFEMSQSSIDFHPMQFGSRVAPAATLKSSSLSPVRNGPVPPRPVPPIQTQQTSAFDQQFKSEQIKSSVMSSLPDLTFHPDTIPVKVTPLKGFQSVKPSSPKGKKKLEVVSTSKDMEESGYAADTEATLPRRLQKISTFQEGGGSTSSSYSKSETSFQSNVSKSFHSAQSSFTSGVPGFPSGFGDSGGFPPPRNGGPGFSCPSFPSHPLGQETRTSSSFTSSESKSSQVYSTTKSEEYYERRSDHVHKGSSSTTPKDMKDHRESKHEDKKQKDHKKPIFEEFHRETKGTPHSYGPFSEDSYYSMHDESEEIEDGRKKKSKVEMNTESHVQVMSDKKSEFYSYSSGDNLEKPQKESPKLKKKKISKPHSEIKIEIETQAPKKDISKMESYHKEELSKEQILKTTTSSDFEEKSESARLIHRKSPTPSSKYDRHIHQEYEQVTKPKIEFPESESDSKESLIKPKKIVRMKPDPPRIVPKEPLILKSEPPKKTEYKEAPSPQLKREPPPEEGYIHPETYPQYPSAVGVESTRVTKIEDSSQFHKRFVTMQQTTRVVKFNGSAVTTTSKTQPDVQQRVQPMKLHVRELPSIEMKPMPDLEPFPFTPEPPRKPRHRGQPPSKPKKFVKGDMRESDYDSDIDIKVKPIWQPPDSDAEELSYGKVEAPRMTKHRVSSKERTPTPPSVFDTPPPTGEPMRPTIEPVEIIPYKEPSPEIIVPKEEVIPLKKKIQLTTAKVRPVKPEPVRELSPPLPPPEPEPEVGIVVEKIDYVVNGINLETKPAPLTMKAVPTFKKKPYREIIEKTEKKITSRHYKEEKMLTTQKLETVKTTVTDIRPKLDEQRFIEEKKITDLEKFSKLEPFPFEPEEKHPKREKGPPPPQPKKFVKCEMSDREYDSDYDIKITPKWKPSESDVEEPHYNKLDISLPKGRRPEKGDRTPTPPSKFDTGPIETGPLRPSLDEVIRDIQPVIQAEPRLMVVKQALSEHIKREVPIIVPEPEPEIGFIEPETKSVVQRKPDIDIDIDIVDIYDYMSESDLERGTSEIGTSEIGSYKPVPELEPFPYSPEPPRPRRERGPPPPTPRKFLKGEFRGSDYESDRDIKIIPKWAPTDSDGEGLAYRKVQPPAADTKRTRTVSTERVPSPPSKFDHPPHFEGPPRPIVDLSDIPRRERRESLEEYSIPKFPKVEFKPFDLEDETKLRTQTSIDKRHVKTTQKYVGEQFEDMHKTFRHKAQKFAEQLVTEVFASKDDTGTIEPSTPIPKDQRVPSEAKIKPADEGLEQPQTYRDESRLSEFGTKHIDPDTGLIYFKYDFGYEFGVVFPGKAKKVTKKKKDGPHGEQNGDIEIPVQHFYSDDESRYRKPSTDKTKPPKPRAESLDKSGPSELSEMDDDYNPFKGKVIPKFLPKKQLQFKPISSDPYSDSEKELGSTFKRLPWASGTQKKGFVPFGRGAYIHPQKKPGGNLNSA